MVQPDQDPVRGIEAGADYVSRYYKHFPVEVGNPQEAEVLAEEDKAVARAERAGVGVQPGEVAAVDTVQPE